MSAILPVLEVDGAACISAAGAASCVSPGHR